MNIEELTKKFVNLASKTTLSKTEHVEARKLMCELKKSGMSNQEISTLSGGKWSESTVKGYTKGVKAENTSPWQNIAGLLHDVIKTGIALEDLDTAVVMVEDLKTRGVTLDDMAEILLTADSASISLDIIVQLAKTIKEGGLKPNDVTNTVEMKKQIEENGFSLDSLPVLAKLAQTYGEPQKVIEAFSAYGSLSELKREVEVTQDNLGELKAGVNSLEQKSQQAKTDLSELEKPLQAYQNIFSLGFDEEELVKLANLAEIYGGHKVVLQALTLYADYQEIMEKTGEAKSQLNTLQTETGKINVKYDHLKSAVTMCDSLLYTHKFGLDAIVSILSVAKKYGQPLNVLKALDKYGSLKLLSDKNYEAEGQVQEKEKLLHLLEGQYQAALNQIESLSTVMLKVGVEVTELKSKLASSKLTAKMIGFVNNPSSASYIDYGHVVVVFAVALLVWARENQHNFKSAFSIETGLKSLISELGGD